MVAVVAKKSGGKKSFDDATNERVREAVREILRRAWLCLTSDACPRSRRAAHKVRSCVGPL